MDIHRIFSVHFTLCLLDGEQECMLAVRLVGSIYGEK